MSFQKLIDDFSFLTKQCPQFPKNMGSEHHPYLAPYTLSVMLLHNNRSLAK